MKPTLGGVFLALLPLVCCTQLADAVETPKLAFGVLVLALGLCLKGIPSRCPRGPVTYCVLGFIGSLLLSFFLHGLAEGGQQCVQVAVAGVFYLLWRSGLWGGPGEWTPTVLWGWWGSALYSWMQRLHLDPLDWGHPELSQARTIGGLGNPNFLAFYLAVLAPLAWVEFVAVERKAVWRQIVAGLIWIAATLAFVLTVTRASWVALAACSPLIFWGAWRWHPQLRRPLVATLAVSALLTPFVLNVEVSRQEHFTVVGRASQIINAKDDSWNVRLMLWKAAWAESLERPVLGWGEGWFPHRALFHRENEPMAIRAAQRVPENPHNQYMEILVHGGVLTLGFYIAAGLMALKYGLRRASQSPRQLALVAGLLAFAINCLAIDATFTLQIILVWLLASLEEVDSSRPQWRIPAAALGIALTIWAVSLVVCERLLWNGDGLVESSKASGDPFPPQALQLFRQAATLAPPWRFKSAEMRQIYTGSPTNVSLLRTLCEFYPEDAWLQRTLAIECETNGGDRPDVTTITQAWQRATASDPFNPAFFYFQSRWLLRIGDFQGSLKAIERSLEIYPGSVDAHFQRALALHLAGQEDEALREWAAVIGLNPSLAEKRPW